MKIVEDEIQDAQSARDAADDAEIAEMDARSAREQKIGLLIRHAFKRVGLTIAAEDIGWPVGYDEQPDREAVVILEDEPNGWSIRALNALYETGLASEYVVQPSGDINHIQVRFQVSPELDDALDRDVRPHPLTGRRN